MTEVSSDFMDLSKKVAESFLHTVVIVDDQAEFGENFFPKPDKLVNPGRTAKREEAQSGCLFSWDEIPGNDNGKLIDFLKQNLSIDWINTAKIEKIDNDKTIRIYTEEKKLFLRLDDRKTKASTMTDDVRTYSLSVKEENGKLNIYKYGSGDEHRLDAKKVMDLFASKGMICSVLRPNDNEDPLNIIGKAAKRADVFMLDWEIHNDDGETAIKIIKSIITSDLKDSPRLRLILIYTGEGGIVRISEKIRDKFAGLKTFGDNFTFSDGHLHIAIFAKEGANVPENLRGRVLSIEELPNRLSVEFAKITSGLVSNVVLEAISVLRDNTHLILGRLGPEIDPPYLAHRVLLPNPDDAMDHVVDIIASEIHSILENYEVGNIANLDAIKKWLKDSNKETNFKLHFSESTKEIDFETMILFFEDGFDEVRKKINKNETEDSKRLGDKSFKNFTKTFCFDGQTSDELDCKFSMLTSLKNRYEGKSNPVMTLGTIIKENSTAGFQDYWLCILPRCDCVRFEGKRNFFFLYLEEEKSNKKFDVVVQDENDNFVKLKINPKIYQSKFTHFEFEANVSNQVEFVKEGDHLILNTADKMKHFKWVSEIKKEHAQRIVNNFAFEISRIGLDESEWLRRWAK